MCFLHRTKKLPCLNANKRRRARSCTPNSKFALDVLFPRQVKAPEKATGLFLVATTRESRRFSWRAELRQCSLRDSSPLASRASSRLGEQRLSTLSSSWSVEVADFHSDSFIKPHNPIIYEDDGTANGPPIAKRIWRRGGFPRTGRVRRKRNSRSKLAEAVSQRRKRQHFQCTSSQYDRHCLSR